ncbi:MAG: STAS domain-containing protein [Armatimonadota bacterium]|nr:STAS domain-containing protein [Armatimonadota bacterium]
MIRLLTRFAPIPIVYAGGLVGGDDANQLKSTLLDLIDRGFDSIALELADVSGIDPVGIGALLAARGRLSHTGGRLHLVNCSKEVLEDLQDTGMTEIFGQYDRPEDIPAPA